MSRGLRREEHTICTAGSVFTVRTYGDTALPTTRN